MADELIVQCPECDARLRLKDRRALGKKVPCPKCRQPFLVKDEPAEARPLTDELDTVETSSTKTPSPASRKSRSKPSSKPVVTQQRGKKSNKPQSKKSALVFGGIVGAVLLIGLGAWAINGGGSGATTTNNASVAPIGGGATPAPVAQPAAAVAPIASTTTPPATAAPTTAPTEQPAATTPAPLAQASIPVATQPQATIPVNQPATSSAATSVAPGTNVTTSTTITTTTNPPAAVTPPAATAPIVAATPDAKRALAERASSAVSGGTFKMIRRDGSTAPAITTPAATEQKPAEQPKPEPQAAAPLPAATIAVQTPPAATPPATTPPQASPTEVAVVTTPAPTAPAATNAPMESALGRQVPPFTAVAIDNTTFNSGDRKEKLIVAAFMGVQCPLANLYLPTMSELAAKYGDKSVVFVAINSNEQDTLQDVQTQAKDAGIKFAVLKDASGEVAAAFAAQRTPEVFVLDAERKVRYHGMFDDQYGYQHKREEPKQMYVANALDKLLADSVPEPAETPIQGCFIGRKHESTSVADTSFHRDVEPILQKRCQNCHRAGNIGPFVLTDYQEAANWGESIREAVVSHRMPPWPAESKPGAFSNDMTLAQQEIDTIVKWVDQGCPEGNSADAPKPIEFVEDWNIGKPDEIFNMPAAEKIPASGVVPYRYVAVTEPFKTDKWVKAVECKVGNPSVVHHILALVRFPGASEGQDGLKNGFFAGAAPGNNYSIFAEGTAKFIPKGAQIIFQMHYTPNGKETSDRSSLGLKYTTEPKFVVGTYAVGSLDLDIKAGDANYKKIEREPITEERTLTSLMPHLHVRGTSFQYRARFPGQKEEQVLLSIPKWDFNWQHEYKFAQPVKLPKGTELIAEASWDNSENNPNNYLPLVDVRFGEQTFDEMFLGYLNWSIPIEEFNSMRGPQTGSAKKKAR